MKFPFIFNVVDTFWEVRNTLKGYIGNISEILPNDILPLKIKIVKCVTGEITYEVETTGNSWFEKYDFYFEDIRVYSNNDFLIWEQKWDIFRESNYQFFKLLTSYKNTNGIVVGAHDGTYGEWVTILDNPNNNITLIEPTDNQFNKLKKYFGDKKNITIIKTLISVDGGEVNFYEGPMGHFNSIDIDHLKKYTTEEKIRQVKIESMSMVDLIEQYSGGNLDWIHIDTEGYDAKLILSLESYKNLLPNLIIYENNHISIEERYKLERFLKNENYDLIKFEDNIFALKNEVR